MNPEVYIPGSKQVLGHAAALPPGLSFLDYMLLETERLHSLVRRFTAPDETAFFPADLPQPLLPPLRGPRVLYPNAININDQVKAVYLHRILPQICRPQTEPNSYGSTGVADIAVLQALSKRVHYGKFIAESKFQADPETYTALIRANDTAGIMARLTDSAQEERVLQRVEMKASLFGSDITTAGPRPEYKVQPAAIQALYRDYVIPLTKDVEVAYLLQRVDHTAVAVAGEALDDSNPAVRAACQQFGAHIQRRLLLVRGAPEVFQAVMQDDVRYGILLMEDSATGSLRHTFLFDLFGAANLQICAEVYVTMPPPAAAASIFMNAKAKDRHMRYVVISKEGARATGSDRTAVCFGPRHESGGLRACLGVLQAHNINLLSIQSHLLGEEPMIFAEFAGHREEAAVRAALTDLRAHASFVTVLGSFINIEGPNAGSGHLPLPRRCPHNETPPAATLVFDPT
eukprot:TRINITY_DN2937_c0_g1_i1.p1 TRINITY_DN2937_c0_g1~~TRINITY_DN2937_c0_g1_i1.p1  ORF type:complete len:459 (-),score=188.23 TRINITY_DN2937_c0_g1_i1:13-1389(-)